MGQYYYTVNLDKREYLNPHAFGDGLKLLEFGCSGNGTMCGLAILLADGNGRGGGDLRSESEIIGTWRGDRIIVAGDYADADNFVPDDLKQKVYDAAFKDHMKGTEKLSGDSLREKVERAEEYSKSNVNVYHCCTYGFFKDISEEVLLAMLDDQYIKEDMRETLLQRDQYRPLPKKVKRKLLAKPKVKR